MYDLITIGNISIDLYFQGKSLTHNSERFQLALGGKYFTDFFYEDIGGSGCNVATGVSKLGYKTAVFGTIGNNSFKEMILQKLKEKNVSSELCQFKENYYKISSILLNEFGERTIVNYETPANLVRSFELSESLKKAKTVFMGPLPHVSLEEKTKIITHFKGPNVLTIVNLVSVDCQKNYQELMPIFDGLDILIINSHEFSDLIKKPYDQIFFNEQVTANIEILKDRIVIITDAEKGSYGYYKDQIFYQNAVIPQKIVDTTGCGDGYTAGFIASYLKNKDIKIAMEEGAKYASIIISKIGAS